VGEKKMGTTLVKKRRGNHGELITFTNPWKQRIREWSKKGSKNVDSKRGGTAEEKKKIDRQDKVSLVEKTKPRGQCAGQRNIGRGTERKNLYGQIPQATKLLTRDKR